MRFEYFQMIDRIVALDVAERAVRSISLVPKKTTIFEGHFPGYPLMPGALLIECMAQTVGWLVMALCGFQAMAFMAGVTEAKFRAAVFPGDELEFKGGIVHEGSGYAIGECTGIRQGKIVCSSQITYRTLSFPNPEFRQAMFEWAERIGVPMKELSK
jgi:3-hydroxyacyl-[acyl-carrier-protein] dehydratase